MTNERSALLKNALNPLALAGGDKRFGKRRGVIGRSNSLSRLAAALPTLRTTDESMPLSPIAGSPHTPSARKIRKMCGTAIAAAETPETLGGVGATTPLQRREDEEARG